MLAARETDEDAAAAWEDRMEALREGCRCVIECLEREHLLAPGWDVADAADLFYGMLSVPLWESLIVERGWSQEQYIARMQSVLQRIFIGGERGINPFAAG